MEAAIRFLAVAFGGVMLSAVGASGAPVYESSGGTAPYQISDNGFTALGDNVSLGGEEREKDRRIGSAVVPLNTFSNANTPAYKPVNLRLTLYHTFGSTSGSVIASSTVQGPQFPEGGNSATGGIDVAFPFEDIEVPDVFLFTVADLDKNFVPVTSTPESRNRFGVFLSKGVHPNPGGSPDTIVYESGGERAELELANPPANVDITFNTPLPEPASLGLVMLAALGLARRRRCRQP